MTDWLELACRSAACAPPPIGTGGSTPGTGAKTHGVGVSEDPNSDSLITVVKPRPGESMKDFHDRIFRDGQERYQAVTELEHAARDHRAKLGLPQPKVVDWTAIEAPWDRAVELGEAFDKLKSNPNDERVAAAYKSLVAQAKDQFKLLTAPESEGGLGIKVSFVTPDDIRRDYGDEEGLNPYPTAEAQANDLRVNKHLAIATLASYPEAYHPILDNSQGGEYDTFRAVHDAFGHAAIGADFTRHGEFQAWLHHVSMFSGDAALAASTELTGENSYLFTQGKGAAPHKAGLLPPELADPWRPDSAVNPWGSDGSLPFAAGSKVVGGDPYTVEKWGLVDSKNALLAEIHYRNLRPVTASGWIELAVVATY